MINRHPCGPFVRRWLTVAFVVLMGWALVDLPEVRAQEQTTQETAWITVRPGDTLFSISHRHDVSVDDLRAWNDFETNAIRAGMRLRVRAPEPSEVGSAEDEPPESSSGMSSDAIPESSDSPEVSPAEDGPLPVRVLGSGTAAVRIPADATPESLAIRLGIPVDSLFAWNPDLTLPMQEGLPLFLPPGMILRVHTVKRGETLFAIARKYGTTVSRIRAMNGGIGNALRIGQQLRVLGATGSVEEAEFLTDAGQFAIRLYPTGQAGRRLSEGRTYDPEAFQVGHPTLEPGELVLIETEKGRHVLCEVVETAPDRSPFFVEGSRSAMDALGVPAGTSVRFYRIDGLPHGQ
ncbi:MAG: LysM peptidoglycan-binding domain-containing protein [Bacteroidota bacterium]|nr:LysM peptidoglycan-binding domain-containing protein [Bacteroidota bacterium]